MYTLRKVIDNVQHNQSIGENYQVIERDSNYNEFRKAYHTLFKSEHVADKDTNSDNFTKECYIILIVKSGTEMIPLYKNQKNYIMTESGKTFCNLSYK